MVFDKSASIKTENVTFDLLRKKIKNELESKNISVSKAEKISGIGSGTLRNFLLGKTNSLSIPTLFAILKTLDCSIDQLLSAHNAAAGFTPEENHSFLPLYYSCLKRLGQDLNERGISLEIDDYLIITREIYNFSSQKKLTSADPDFSRWYVGKFLNNKREKNKSIMHSISYT